MKKTGKIRNAVIAFIGIFVILAAVIGYVDHAEAISKKTKEVALHTLVDVDENLNDNDVVKISYEYDPQADAWREVVEHSDGTYDGEVF